MSGGFAILAANTYPLACACARACVRVRVRACGVHHIALADLAFPKWKNTFSTKGLTIAETSGQWASIKYISGFPTGRLGREPGKLTWTGNESEAGTGSTRVTSASA
jgi:hypothetical protein